MTREQASQIAHEIVTMYDLHRSISGSLARSIAAALMAAVAEERERSAARCASPGGGH